MLSHWRCRKTKKLSRAQLWKFLNLLEVERWHNLYKD